MKVQEPDAEKSVRKRRKRREQVLESKETSKLQVMLVFLIKELSLSSSCLFLRWPLMNVIIEQKIISRMKRFLLFVFILVILLAATYYGYKGLLWLNDWMNEVDERRQIYSRIKWLFISLIAPFIHHFFLSVWLHYISSLSMRLYSAFNLIWFDLDGFVIFSKTRKSLHHLIDIQTRREFPKVSKWEAKVK